MATNISAKTLQGSTSTSGTLQGSASTGGTSRGTVGTAYGVDGKDGASAYEIALANGFEGTEQEWLESLKGKDGTMNFEELTEDQKATLKGDAGPQGPQGDKGEKGDKGADGQDGYTPIKGKDYFDGKNGIDGEDGFSPIVAVEDIDNGHRVTITDKDGAKTFDVMDGADGAGGGSDPAIIDVVELPTDDIQEDRFYRVLSGQFVYNQFVNNRYICHCVEAIPETGEPCLSGDLSNGVNSATITCYYNITDNGCYGYVNSMLSGVFGVPAGWYPASALMQAVGQTFNGVITDIADDPMDSSWRLLIEYNLYSYKDEWISHKVIGKAGIGNGAEVFNHPTNIASGGSSHAEGYKTTASGTYSHAEGYSTEASGYQSHAEGSWTTASGYQSHAEGYNTEASGYRSHAEGGTTYASGDYQHVQGKYNIEDPNSKYAHIVGNGDSLASRSNAHTLDWNGLGWFAGGLKIGGTGQDDENAVAVLTEADMATITENVISALPIYNGEVVAI